MGTRHIAINPDRASGSSPAHSTDAIRKMTRPAEGVVPRTFPRLPFSAGLPATSLNYTPGLRLAHALAMALLLTVSLVGCLAGEPGDSALPPSEAAAAVSRALATRREAVAALAAGGTIRVRLTHQTRELTNSRIVDKRSDDKLAITLSPEPCVISVAHVDEDTWDDIGEVSPRDVTSADIKDLLTWPAYYLEHQRGVEQIEVIGGGRELVLTLADDTWTENDLQAQKSATSGSMFVGDLDPPVVFRRTVHLLIDALDGREELTATDSSQRIVLVDSSSLAALSGIEPPSSEPCTKVET